MSPEKKPKLAKPVVSKDAEVSPVAVVEELGVELLHETGEIIEKVVYVNRSAKVVKGGRRFHFSALVVAGDRRGHVGWGFGKANEVADAIRKGTEQAKKAMVYVNLRGPTIPHEVLGVFGGGRVLLRPASPGTGVIAGGGARAVIEAAGVRDVLTKSLGSSNAVNVVKATIDALLKLRPQSEIMRVRGISRTAAARAS
jgi:small subunit ribosomal protein S5